MHFQNIYCKRTHTHTLTVAVLMHNIIWTIIFLYYRLLLFSERGGGPVGCHIKALNLTATTTLGLNYFIVNRSLYLIPLQPPFELNLDNLEPIIDLYIDKLLNKNKDGLKLFVCLFVCILVC